MSQQDERRDTQLREERTSLEKREPAERRENQLREERTS